MDKNEQYVIVELFGHNQIAGLMSECAIGGCSFVRIDVPGTKTCPGYTKLYGNGAIYAITMTDEETARAAAEHIFPKPMTPWSAREMLRMIEPVKTTGQGDDYSVQCTDDDCTWSGLKSQAMDPEQGQSFCPKCGAPVEPIEYEIPM